MTTALIARSESTDRWRQTDRQMTGDSRQLMNTLTDSQHVITESIFQFCLSYICHITTQIVHYLASHADFHGLIT